MQTHTTNIWKKKKKKFGPTIWDIYMAFFTTLGGGSKHTYNTVKIYNNQY